MARFLVGYFMIVAYTFVLRVKHVLRHERENVRSDVVVVVATTFCGDVSVNARAVCDFAPMGVLVVRAAVARRQKSYVYRSIEGL